VTVWLVVSKARVRRLLSTPEGAVDGVRVALEASEEPPWDDDGRLLQIPVDELLLAALAGE
jgi:hypothetical protein